MGARRDRRAYVHQLVASAFVDRADASKAEVNHLNGNKLDNRAENLAWVTRSENCLHSTHVLGNKAGQFVRKV